MSSLKRIVNKIETCDVLVAGGGTAGCFAAIKAAEKKQAVILVDKGHIGRSGCSPFAAGAINICYPDDNQDLWFEEIVTRGEYLNDQDWVKIQLAEAYDRSMELHNWGKQYGMRVLEEDESGNFIRRTGRGNIHTRTNVINALPMMDTLRRKSLDAGVKLVERVMLTHLVVQQERVVGAMGLHCRTGESHLFLAKAVVLSAGGCGFKSFFIGHRNLTGEAQYMAMRIGAHLRNLDQAMSNTTSREIDIHGLSLMVGLGGRFLNAMDEEFMLRYDPEVGSRARLTRVVVGMAKEVDAGRGPIYFDLTRVQPDDQKLLRRILPEGFRAFERLGTDPFKQKIEWIPAFEGTLAHGGGIHMDTTCASNIPGLYSAGDTSCAPEHGTWSITGLNLSFCFVSGARAGNHAAGWAQKQAEVKLSKANEQSIRANIAELTAPAKRNSEITPDALSYKLLEALIPYRVAYLRDEASLQQALDTIKNLTDEKLPRVYAKSVHELVKAFEIRSMLAIAEAVVASVRYRRESRGFVYRRDYPLTDNVDWLKWVMVTMEDEKLRVWAQDFPTPYLSPPRKKYPIF
ncbi:MAG: FAD-binding protein [Thermodesulfobacteriota bacterium]